MTITPESKQALVRRKKEIIHEMTMLDDRRYKINRRVTKDQKRIDKIDAKMAELLDDKTKIEGDIV